MTFADRLSKILADKKITPYKLSKDTGIAQSQISNWRNGSKLPSYENIVLLSAYLKVSTDCLLGIVDGIDLTEQEQQLVDLFRKSHPYDQRDLLEIAQIKANRVEEEVTSQQSNNDSGQTA